MKRNELMLRDISVLANDLDRKIINPFFSHEFSQLLLDRVLSPSETEVIPEYLFCFLLGKLRSKVTNGRVRSLLLTEMIARSLFVKTWSRIIGVARSMPFLLKDALTGESDEILDNFAVASVEDLNRALGNSSEATTFWTETLKKQLIVEYGEDSLNEDEKSDKESLRRSIFVIKESFVRNLLIDFSVELSMECYEEVFSNQNFFDKSEPFRKEDLVLLSPTEGKVEYLPKGAIDVGGHGLDAPDDVSSIYIDLYAGAHFTSDEVVEEGESPGSDAENKVEDILYDREMGFNESEVPDLIEAHERYHDTVYIEDDDQWLVLEGEGFPEDPMATQFKSKKSKKSKTKEEKCTLQ